MEPTLPDIVRDDSAPMLFAAGFSILLLALIVIFGFVMLARHRARTQGIYNKYTTAGERPVRRSTIRTP